MLTSIYYLTFPKAYKEIIAKNLFFYFFAFLILIKKILFQNKKNYLNENVRKSYISRKCYV